MIEIIGTALLLILGITYAGAGIAGLLLPISERFLFWPVAFWTGVVWIGLSGTIFSQMGIPTQQSWLLIAMTSSIWLGIARKRLKPIMRIETNERWVGALTIVTLFIQLITYLTRAGFPTTISMGNLDPISYATVADFLQKQTVSDGASYQDFSPYLWSVGDLLHHSFRWGTPIILSVLSAASRVRSYQLYGILISVFFSLSYPILWGLVKKMRPESGKLEALILFFVYALNSTLMYTLYNVFFAQFAWSGILIMSTYLTTVKETRLLKALTIVGTALIYPEGIIFVILPYLLLKQWRACLLALLIAPYAIFTSWRQVMIVMINSSRVSWIGWEKIRVANLFEILGLYNLHYSRPLPIYVWALPLTLLTAILIFGFVKAQNRRTVGVYLTVFGLSYASTLASGNWFTFFRAVTYSIFIFAALLVVGVSKTWERTKKIGPRIIIILIIAAMSIRSAGRTAKQMYYHHHTVDYALISLRELPESEKNLVATADVWLGEYSLWIRLWREYMLMGRPLLTRQNLTTDLSKVARLTRVLVEKDKVAELALRIQLGRKIWENEYYELYAIDIPTEQVKL